MSLTNETRHIKWHESCRCICRLDGIICNSKQRWNEDKCKCECKELVDPLIEECTENIDETKLVEKTLDENKDRCNSYVIYRMLFWIFFIFFIISIVIGIYFVYHKYLNCNKYNLPY